MTSKKVKKQQEELPSFLLNVNQIPSELKLPTKETTSDHYLGPLFFGGCFQHHPPHVIPREHLPSAIFTTISEEEIIENIFVATSTENSTENTASKTVESVFQKRKVLARKRESFELPVSHYGGVRKVFVPEVGPHEADLGETESEISGEMCREIPICRVVSCSSISEEYEMVNLSDIREQNRPFMPYNERIAHPHFLKEFVTVKIIGPKIPADITIKKLPTKRKRISDFNFQSRSKKNKQEVSKEDVKDEIAEEEEEEESQEEQDDVSTEELMKQTSIKEELNDTLNDLKMETPSEMLKEEDSQGEFVMKEEDDGQVYDEGRDGYSFHSDQRELEAKEQVEPEEEEGEIQENEKPEQEKEGEEEK